MADGIDMTAATEGEALDALRQRIRHIQQNERRTWGALAKMIGVGESTLSAFAAGKYLGDNAKVGDLVQLWLGTREAEARTRATLPTALPYIATRSADAFCGVLEHAQYAPDIVVIGGGAGVGKTSAVRHYAATHRNVWVITGEPAVATTHSVLELLCEAVGVIENSANRRSRSLAVRLTGSAGLIIVDEAQHLSTHAIDQLRTTVHDKAEIGLALVGNEGVWARVGMGDRMGKLAQLASRVGMKIIRSQPLMSDIESLLDAAGVVGDLERATLVSIARRPGALRGMLKVLRMATLLAHGGDGSGTPTVQHIRTAWGRLSDSAPLDQAGAA